MTKLTKNDVLRLAKLARLNLSSDELTSFIDEIGAILGYVEQLKSLNLDKYEPTYQVTGLENVMRPDEVIDYGSSPEELLKNAPAVENGHIKVRRVIE